MNHLEGGQGSPDNQEPTGHRKTPVPEQAPANRCRKSTIVQQERGEGQPLSRPTEDQAGPADLNVSSADTVDAESPEVGLEDKFPRKLRRWRSSSVGGGRLHGYGEDEIRKQNPPPPSNDQQQ